MPTRAAQRRRQTPATEPFERTLTHWLTPTYRIKVRKAITRATRRKHLTAAARTLRELGYVGLRPQGLLPTHVTAIVRAWQDQGLTPLTIRNRLSTLRWITRVSGNPSAVAHTNNVYLKNRG